MKDCLTFDGDFGNAGSRSHSFGWKAEELVEEARLNVANLVSWILVKLFLLQVLLSQITLQLRGCLFLQK